MNIWDFLHYRDYLNEKLGQTGTRSGLRKKLAEFIPVHTTFVSQVLLGKADFSIEQAEMINQFLNHLDEESEYFIYLVLKERAGSQNLKKRFLNKINQLRKERINIKKRLQVDNVIHEKDQQKYYSSWVYGAAYVLCSIPQFQTLDKLSEILKLNRQKTQEVIQFLLEVGLLNKVDHRFVIGSKHIHIDKSSILNLQHQSQWRQHAIMNLQSQDEDDLHFSSCLSLSYEDAYRIKESILKNLKFNTDIIKQSKEETAYVMNLDFYKMG